MKRRSLMALGAALHALGGLRLEAKTAVPAVIRCLKDPNHSLTDVMMTLYLFGSDARSALPELRAIRAEQDETTPEGKRIRLAAEHAIERIERRQPDK